jgi:hypothetical protein
MTDAPATGVPGQNGASPAPPGAGDTERLQAEIEQTREQLGETVAALEDKLDVKARASAGIHDAVYDEHGDMKPVVPALAAGALLLVGLLVWHHRRN